MDARLPAMRGYGYMGSDVQAPFDASFAYNMGQIPQVPAPPPPDQVAREFASLPQPSQVPDIARIPYSKGDRVMVGKLLRTAEGKEGGISGLSMEDAVKVLSGWGYPTSMNAISAEEWDGLLAANAINPLEMLGY